MERSRDYADIGAALATVRPIPTAAFAESLDARVATGFPRPARSNLAPLAAITDRLHSSPPQRLLLAFGATAFAVVAIATVVVAGNQSTPKPLGVGVGVRAQPHEAPASAEPQPRSPDFGAATKHGDGPEIQYSDTPPARASGPEFLNSTGASSLRRSRAIERSAEIGLLADPADVAEDSAKVFSAVHDARGIVLHSTTTAGRNAGAHFDLLIPSAKLGDALAAFSAIDEVRSRHEATDDITTHTVSAAEELQDSRARIDSLLSQLATAETESEREALEIELRGERRQAAALRSQLTRLHRRTHFSRVSIRIESAPSTASGGAWGFDDAIDDAGHILAIAAGVTVVGLAVIAPLTLIFLLAWLARRTLLRRARDRALA
jgi:hypothetical protein